MPRRVDPAAWLGYAVRRGRRDGVAEVPRVCSERVIRALADVQANEDAIEARVARSQTTRLWEQSRYAVRGVGEV